MGDLRYLSRRPHEMPNSCIDVDLNPDSAQRYQFTLPGVSKRISQSQTRFDHLGVHTEETLVILHAGT